MKESVPSPPPTPTVIRQLRVNRFRGIEELTWCPFAGLNLILGGGDVGKTTILDAISILLAPSNSYVVTEADYFQRQVVAEFSIEAVLTMGSRVPVNRQTSMNWPWEWDGERLIAPVGSAQELGVSSLFRFEPAYYVRVRGTSELELLYELVQPDGTNTIFSSGLRRSIGLVRLAGDDRNDRDLRLVQGSALSRLLDDRAIRKRLGQELSSSAVEAHLTNEAEVHMVQLKERFAERSLPADLGLGITGTPGMSIGPLIGLTAKRDETVLPLAVWGAGTRRLAALTISDTLQDNPPIAVIDEIERGLEPYRQRLLIESLLSSGNQVFVTSHSAAIISAATTAALWFLDSSGVLGELPKEKIVEHQHRDPDMFLSRLTIVAEGITEVGFSEVILEKALSIRFRDRGICITDGHGQASTLNLLEALARGGLRFAAVVDSAEDEPGRWGKLKEKLGNLLLQWTSRSIEAHVISKISDKNLMGLLEDSESDTGARAYTLARRLGLLGSADNLEALDAVPKSQLRAAIIDASTGVVPPNTANLPKEIRNQFRGDSKFWFKSLQGGRELARRIFDLDIWPLLRAEVMPFVNAIRAECGLGTLDDLK